MIKTHEITDHISLIKGENYGRFPFSHSIVIDDEVTALIDTGCGITRLRALEDIDIIINSHSHPDHTAGNWIFSALPLHVPREEIEFNSNITRLSERYAGEELAPLWRKFVRDRMNFRNAHPTGSFKDSDLFDFGNTQIEAVHTPGHTVGHYCFFEKSQKILFSFDIDFTSFGPWYGHKESDIEEFITSIEKVKALNPEVIVSSHRNIIEEDISSKFQRFIQCFQERDQRILEFLQRERKFEEIVESALIYRDFSFHPQLLRYWESMMITKHLERLVQAGLVVRTGKKFVAQ